MSCPTLRSLDRLTARLLSSRPTRPLCPLLPDQSRSKPPSNSPNRRCAQTLQSRWASTHTSATAVNAQKDIPPQLKELYTGLETLKKEAANYVNLSRLGLAIRSLESRRPTIRVALLGLANTDEARKVGRLLLADVLSERQEWEDRLKELGADDRRGLLLRYGEETSLDSSGSLLNTLHIPSRLLRQHNIEFLVSSLNLFAGLPTGPIDTAELRRTALVPTTETPKTFRGDVSYITYPVHRAIVLGHGIQGCLALGRYATLDLDEREGTGTALKLALSLPRGAAVEDPATDLSGVAVLDLDKGAEAIDKFRESNANAVSYEQLWHRSGVSQLSTWLAKGFAEDGKEDTSPAVTSLISDLASEASSNIAHEEEERTQQIAQPTSMDAARQPLDQALRQWSMRGHQELRDALDAAFASKKWAQIKWWKLMWRVDDVSTTLSDLLDGNWLVDAEKGIIWLSGRGMEAGFALPMESTQPASEFSGKIDSEDQEFDAASGMEVAAVSKFPWPSSIPAARLAIHQSTVPNLQATAQALLVQTLSVTGASAGLASFVYLTLPTASLYSTGAIAALGLAWSLRHLQKRWEAARAAWEGEVREAGRVTLKQIEESFRAMLSRPTEVQLDFLTRDREKAKAAVAELESCLRKVMDGK